MACGLDQGIKGRTLGWKLWGDSVKPKILQVNAQTNEVKDITPTDAQAPNLQYSAGVRGGMAHNGVVLLSSNTTNATGRYLGVEWMAFDGDTGKFLGAADSDI